METPPVVRIPQPVDKGDDGRDDRDHEIDAEVTQEGTDGNQDLGGEGGTLALAGIEYLDDFPRYDAIFCIASISRRAHPKPSPQ